VSYFFHVHDVSPDSDLHSVVSGAKSEPTLEGPSQGFHPAHVGPPFQTFEDLRHPGLNRERHALELSSCLVRDPYSSHGILEFVDPKVNPPPSR